MFNQGRNKDEHTLTLAPFCPAPKVQYEDVEKGTAARRTLHVKNPSKEDVEVSFIKYPQEDKGFTYSWIKRVISAGNSEELEIIWKPFEAGRFYENIALQFGRKFKASISLNGNCIEINKRTNKLKRTPKRRFIKRTLKRKATPGNFDFDTTKDLNTTSTPAKTCENKNATPITTKPKQKQRKPLNLKQTTPAKKIKTFHRRTFVVNSEIRFLKAKNPYNNYVNKTEGTFEKTYVQNRNKDAECGKRKFFGEKDGNSKQCFKQQVSEETYIVKKRKMPDKENIFAGNNKYNLKAKGNNVDSHEKESAFANNRQTLFENTNVLNANSVTNRRDSLNSDKCTVVGKENNVTNKRYSLNGDKCTVGGNDNNVTNRRDSVNSGKCTVGGNGNSVTNKRYSLNGDKCTVEGKENNVTNRRDSVNSDKCTGGGNENNVTNRRGSVNSGKCAAGGNGNNVANKTVLVNREKCAVIENQRNFGNKKAVGNSEQLAAVGNQNNAANKTVLVIDNQRNFGNTKSVGNSEQLAAVANQINVANIKPAGICTVINTTININDALNSDKFTSVEFQNRTDAFNMEKCTAEDFKNNVANKRVSINSEKCTLGRNGSNAANKTILVNREKCTAMENQRNFGNKKAVGNSEQLANNVANIKPAGIGTVINTTINKNDAFNIDKFTSMEFQNRKDAFNSDKCKRVAVNSDKCTNDGWNGSNAANKTVLVSSEKCTVIENQRNFGNKKAVGNSEQLTPVANQNNVANIKPAGICTVINTTINKNDAFHSDKFTSVEIQKRKDAFNSDRCTTEVFKNNVANQRVSVSSDKCTVGWNGSNAANKTVLISSEKCTVIENQGNFVNKKSVGNIEQLTAVANEHNVANIKPAGICTVINTFNSDKFTSVEIPNRREAFNTEKWTAEELKNIAANKKDGVNSEGCQAVENENNAANKKNEVISEQRKAEEFKNNAANKKNEVNSEQRKAEEFKNNAANKKDEVNSEKCTAEAFKDIAANEKDEVNGEKCTAEALKDNAANQKDEVNEAEAFKDNVANTKYDVNSENCKSAENQTNAANKTEALENKNEHFDMEKLNMSSDKITFKRYRDETDEDLFESLDSSNDEFFNSTQRKSGTFSEISAKNEAGKSSEKRKNAGLNFKEWKNISEIVDEDKLSGIKGDLGVNKTDDEKESAKASLNGEEMRIVPKETCERLNSGGKNVANKTNALEKSRKVKLPVNDLHDPDEFLKAISAKICGVKYNWTLAEEAALKERVNCLLAPQIAKTKTNAIDKLMNKRKTQQDSEAEKLRDKATELFRSQEVFKVVSKIISIADAGKISIAQDKNVHNNVNMQQHIITLLLNYNPVWLRVGLETVFEEALALKAKGDIGAITEFAMSKFFKNAHIARKLKSAVSPKYLHEIKKHVLRKFLMLVYFLDSAKSRKILPHDPCLFRRNSGLKDSKAILLAFTTKYLTPVRDIVKLLQAIGLQLTHKQTYLHEFNYACEHAEADFKDGLRLTKLLDAILLTDSVSSLRAPAISRLQKLHNVKLAFDLLAKARCVLPEGITVKDIVGGDRVKTLSLLTCVLRLAEKGCDVAGAT